MDVNFGGGGVLQLEVTQRSIVGSALAIGGHQASGECHVWLLCAFSHCESISISSVVHHFVGQMLRCARNKSVGKATHKRMWVWNCHPWPPEV